MMRLIVDKGERISRADIEKAVQSVQRLSRLPEDLLDLKRLAEGLISLDLVPSSS